MPDNLLICPHCGHEGTAGVSQGPHDRSGFNYLVDEVICREVEGFDESGSLRLTSEFKCEGIHGTNPRIECRSCWQTFTLPEGMNWVLSEPKAAAEVPAQPVPPQPPAPQPGAEAAFPSMAAGIAEQLARVFADAVKQLQGLLAGDVNRLQEELGGLSRVAEEIPALRGDISSLREAAGALTGAHDQLAAHHGETRRQLESHGSAISGLEKALEAIEASLRDLGDRLEQSAAESAANMAQVASQLEGLGQRVQSHAEAAAGLGSATAQLQQQHQALWKRLDTQAEAIRNVHSAAQEQAGRRDELREALQKLEHIAGSLGQPRPLPEEL